MEEKEKKKTNKEKRDTKNAAREAEEFNARVPINNLLPSEILEIVFNLLPPDALDLGSLKCEESEY